MKEYRSLIALAVAGVLLTGCSFGGTKIEKNEGTNSAGSSSLTAETPADSSEAQGNVPTLVIEDTSSIDVMDIEIETKMPDDSIADPPHPETTSSAHSPEIDPPVTTIVPSATQTTTTTTTTSSTTTTTTVSTHEPRVVSLPDSSSKKDGNSGDNNANNGGNNGGNNNSQSGNNPSNSVSGGGIINPEPDGETIFDYDYESPTLPDSNGVIELPIIDV